MLKAPLIALLLVSTILTTPSPASAIEVEAIPSPRPAGWAVDLTGTVKAETLREINRLGDEIKAANGAEIAVVLVDTTEGVPSREFATRLFSHWGIGEREVDNGLLIFAALSDRRAEIVLGRGFDDPAAQAASVEIMQGEIVPRFKSGDPGAALLAGTRACAWRILNVPITEARPSSVAPETLAAAPPQASVKGDDGSDLIVPGALLLLAFGALAYVIWQSRQLASGTSASRGSSSAHPSSDDVQARLWRHSGHATPPSPSSSKSHGSGYSGGQSSGGGSSGSW